MRNITKQTPTVMLPNYTNMIENKELGKQKKKKSTLDLVATSKRKTYITVATKGTLALTGQNEESKHNLEEQSIEAQFSDPLCQPTVSN
jgi:hypothetical protein